MLSLSAPLGTLNARPLEPTTVCPGETHAWTFTPTTPVRGRTGRILVLDLDAGRAIDEGVPDAVVRVFVGGRGLALWMLWRAVSEATSWNAPENAVCT